LDNEVFDIIDARCNHEVYTVLFFTDTAMCLVFLVTVNVQYFICLNEGLT